MAAQKQLEIQGDSSTFTFDVEGSFLPRLEAEYNRSTNPPQIIGLREVWEIRGARLVAETQTSQALATADLWSEFVALRSRIATRGTAFPTYARFVIPGGATLHTLGPTTHEGFAIESLSGADDPANPGSSWVQTASLTIVISALQKFADTNGIVGWEQTTRSAYPDGRHELEWVTEINTAEGTSAVTKAQNYAAIDASALGSTYLYQTGGTTAAVDIETLDADEENSRTPTRVRATSRVRAFGVTIGSVTAGASPSEISYSVTTRTTAKESSVTTVATAKGPGAYQFVIGKAPVSYNEKEIFNETGLMEARGTWTQRSTTPEDEKLSVSFSIQATAAGGQRVVDYEPVADGLPPVEFVGAFQPVVAVVEVEREATGAAPKNADMPLPGHPGAPWRFDADASTEGAPTIKTRSATADLSTWVRRAKLVFRCASPPTTPIHEAMAAVPTVTSYVYPV